MFCIEESSEEKPAAVDDDPDAVPRKLNVAAVSPHMAAKVKQLLRQYKEGQKPAHFRVQPRPPFRPGSPLSVADFYEKEIILWGKQCMQSLMFFVHSQSD